MQRFKRLSKNTKFLVAIALAAAVGGVGATVVQAAIPDADGKIYACYLNNGSVFNAKGTLQVIDKATTSTCPSGTTAISWDKVASSGSATGVLPINAGDVISSAHVTYRDFANANLSNTSIANADFSGSRFNGANFTDAKIQSLHGNEIQFNNVNFTLTDYLENMEVGYSELKSANFSGLTLAPSDFNGASSMHHSDLTGVNFSSTTLEGTYMIESNFTNANFAGASLKNVDLTGGTFTGATLTGTTWDNVTCPDGTNSNSHSNTCVGHL